VSTIAKQVPHGLISFANEAVQAIAALALALGLNRNAMARS
jgi:hypothetical protein